jgi:ketosteroid isomerase-like protein
VATSLYIKSALAAASFFASTAFAAQAQTSAEGSAETAAISAAVTSYEAAMNASNTDALVALYAEDGVLMPPFTHSVIGKAAVREAYVAGSKVFALHVKFIIAEVVQMAPDWAFVRTNSAGIVKINAAGATSDEAIRNFSFSGKKQAANGRSPATASPAPTRRRSSKAMARDEGQKHDLWTVECPPLDRRRMGRIQG